MEYSLVLFGVVPAAFKVVISSNKVYWRNIVYPDDGESVMSKMSAHYFFDNINQ